jgi:hypothetical protein
MSALDGDWWPASCSCHSALIRNVSCGLGDLSHSEILHNIRVLLKWKSFVIVVDKDTETIEHVIEFSPRWSFLRTKPSLRSAAYRLVSSAKRAGFLPTIWRVSFMYKLYSVGDRTEPCGTPAFKSLGIDILPSTETLNFLCERNELSLIRLVEIPL